MTGAEATFIAWAGTQLLSLFSKDSKRALECRSRVAGYFDDIASALSDITPAPLV
jgi:hypothetical protein